MFNTTHFVYTALKTHFIDLRMERWLQLCTFTVPMELTILDKCEGKKFTLTTNETINDSKS